MIDVNEEKPRIEYYINRVGVSKIYIPFYSILNNEKINSVAKISAFIDLPKNYRGVHASRIMESIVEAILEYRDRTFKIEDLCRLISVSLLKKHEYTYKSQVSAQGILIYQTQTPISKKSSVEKLSVSGKAVSRREANGFLSRKFVGIKISGMTACPSAQRTISDYVENSKYVPTHIQRGYAKILIEVPLEKTIDIMDLINIGISAFSTPTYHLLKKEDESKIILDSLENPKFTEDVVREIAWRLVQKYEDFPDETEVFIEYKSIESIHDHDLIAKIYSSFSQLRNI